MDVRVMDLRENNAMNRNLVIVLAGGFLIAIVVALIVQMSLKGKAPQPVAAVDPPVQVIVAAKDLPVGEDLTADDMKLQDWPKGSVFPGAIVNDPQKKLTDQIKGRLVRAVAVGEPLMQSALVQESKGNFVAAELADGMRAVAVETTKANKAAGGFIQPGDYVDVILTYRQQIDYKGANPEVSNMLQTNLEKEATETILQNVRVLALDQSPKPDDDPKNAGLGKIGKTVTLEVNMHDAEVLALAGQIGDISLSLRKLGDNKIYPRDTEVVTDERITTAAHELYGKIREVEKTSSANNNIVRIYNGASVQENHIVQ
jgi:pilus assembly protein CpaB